jgi:hypothetical protein
VSDLNGELLHMVAAGADQARPLTVAEVIRRGNRRRARTIGQRSLGGLSVLSVGVAIVMTGAAHGPAGSPAASTSSSILTLTGTSSSPAGTMTVTVKYRDEPRNKIEVLSVSYSAHTRALIKHGGVLVGFGPSFPSLDGRSRRSGSQRVLLFGVLTPAGSGSHNFSGSLSRNVLAPTRKGGGLSSDDALRVALTISKQTKDGSTTISENTHGLPSLGFVLTR